MAAKQTRMLEEKNYSSVNVGITLIALFIDQMTRYSDRENHTAV